MRDADKNPVVALREIRQRPSSTRPCSRIRLISGMQKACRHRKGPKRSNEMRRDEQELAAALAQGGAEAASQRRCRWARKTTITSNGSADSRSGSQDGGVKAIVPI